METKKIIRLAICELIADEEVNIRTNDLVAAKVDEYAENFGQLPPPDVFLVTFRDKKQKVEVSKYFLVDGVHRVAAAKKKGLLELNFAMVGEGTIDEAKDYADAANMIHGLNLTPEQKKSIAFRVKARHPKWNQDEIAAFLKVDQSTVSRWFSEDSGLNDAPRIKAQSMSKSMVTIQKVGNDFVRAWKKLIESDDPPEKWAKERIVKCLEILKPEHEAYVKLEQLLEQQTVEA